jgi:hypothetical protein
MIGVLLAGIFLMGFFVTAVVFAVLLLQTALVDATPEAGPRGQPGRASTPEPRGDEGKAAA